MGCSHEINSHEINSHEINSHEINSHEINFSRDQFPYDQLNFFLYLIIAININKLCNSNKKKRSLQSSMVFERFKVLINTDVSSIESLKESLDSSLSLSYFPSPWRLFCSRLIETHFHLSGCLLSLNHFNQLKNVGSMHPFERMFMLIGFELCTPLKACLC